MSKKRGDRSSTVARGEQHGRELSVSEVARFLKRLSSFYRDPKTGNPALSDALIELSLALGQSHDLTLTEAVGNSEHFSTPRRSLDSDRLKDVKHEEVKEILSDKATTKADLVDLGAERFAISRSRLKRLKKDQAFEAIWSALRNEESLGIISQEARRGGKESSS